MAIYLYLDRRTFIHRLHPTVKILAIVGIFWSVYWVDNPLSLLPLGVLLLVAAQLTRAWPNFYSLRWLFILVIFGTTADLDFVLSAGASAGQSGAAVRQ